MSFGPLEPYEPRTVSHHGLWVVGDLHFKIYGLLADGQLLEPETFDLARGFLEQDVLNKVAQMGDSNGLGFVILHPGELGLTIAAHWWAQGSVLCQHIYRQQYDADTPLDTVNRPAVACVWELGIIQAEQDIWRATMMCAAPDPDRYRTSRAPFDTV